VFPVLKILLLFLLILVDGASAQDSLSYRCPRGDAVIPASCLEDMKVSDVSRSLRAKERHQLAYLFAKSYVVSKVKYGQDYYVNHDAPISLLLTATFPELVKLRREGGIWLRDVFYFFRSRSEYRVDVERAVRELPASKRRQFVSLRAQSNTAWRLTARSRRRVDGWIQEHSAASAFTVKAKEFLAQRNLLSKTKDNQVAIDPAAIGGLNITLEQIN